MELEELLLKHSGLTVDKENQTLLRGIVENQVSDGLHSTKRQWYHLSLHWPENAFLEVLQGSVQQLHNVHSFSFEAPGRDPHWNAANIVHHLPDLGAQKVGAIEKALDKLSPYAEIAALYAPQSYRIEANANYSRIRFSDFTGHLEQHYLELELPSCHVTQHSLPSCVTFQRMPKVTLSALVSQFQKHIEDLRMFYDTFSDIDQLCHVLQPVLPTTKHNWRLFVLRERVFLKLIIADPFAPLSSMSLRIIGPTTDVAQLRTTYIEGLRNWDPEVDIHKNLLRIFDLCFFPMPPQASSDTCGDDSELACNICLNYQLDEGDIPLVSCDNLNCKVIFHASCLREWFNTLADGKVFLEVSFGACPFCKAKMSTSFAELLES